MFVKAIEKASGFLRPVHSVYRYYNEAVVNKTAFNIVFVNESGVAITARHVAERMEKLTGAYDHYRSFLREKEKLRGTIKSSGLRRLETSTPGLKGQSGGPLINSKGDVCGMNINASSLEFQYNFKIPAGETLKEPVTFNYQPKLLVGNCLHADIIVNFLKYYKLKYYTV